MNWDIKRIMAVASITASAAGFCSSASAANLVVNGSFENDVITSYPWYTLSVPTGWVKGGSAGDASVWRIGYVDGGGTITVAGEGSQFVTMGGGYMASGTTTWSQTVGGLTIGQAYDLKFRIAGEGPCCGTQTVFVDFLGASTPGQSFSASVRPSTSSTRISRSACARSKPPHSASYIATVSAFRLSGRLSVSRLTGPERSTMS